MQQIHAFKMCTTIDNYGAVFILREPKLVYSLSKQNINLPLSYSYEPYKANNNLHDIDSSFYRQQEKDEEVYKNNNEAETYIAVRKNKSKFRKKNRSKNHEKNTDLFVNNSTNVPAHEHTDGSSLKLRKSSRKKKKSKGQTQFSDYKIDRNADSSIIERSSINNNPVIIDSPLTIDELSSKLKIPETEIITNLFLKGISVTVNQVVDISIATEIANSYNFDVLTGLDESTIMPSTKEIANNSSSVSNSSRPPVITMFGHVDHGKTTLLNTIIKSTIKEAGGITQSICSYEIECSYESKMKKLVFLDMPGHEAFSRMRLRGVQVTDIAILVIAADDGLKQQTIEAIQYITNYQLPCVVAITKVDKQGLNILRLKEELAKYNVVDELWGGNYPIVEVSALDGKNIDLLLSTICVLSDMQNLQVNLDQAAKGIVLESHIDKKKGTVASIIVKNGTLSQGDIIVANNSYGRVKLIVDNAGKKLKQATPSSVVEVLGFSSVLHVGANFSIVDNEKNAKQLVQKQSKYRNEFDIRKIFNTRITLDSYKGKSCIKQLNMILKTDKQGSIEAIVDALFKLTQDKVQINILKASSGTVSRNDLQLAANSNALILCFNTDTSMDLKCLINNLNIVIKSFDVIYDLIDYVKATMIDLIDPEYDKIAIGEAIVQTVFPVNKGSVAGCLVRSGKLKKNSQISIYRNNCLLHEGILDSLKRLKDNVDQVDAGNECGIMCNDYSSWEEKDIIKAYELNEKQKQL